MDKDEILKILKNNGYKNTNQRIEIIEAISSENRYISVKEIYSKVRYKFPKMSFDTIYRNLSMLSDLGLIDVIHQEGEAKYKIICIKDHHHHMICQCCGEISVIKKCPMEYLGEIEQDFLITDHKFEIYGVCKKCQDKQNK